MVLSTVSPAGNPEAATVECVVTESFQVIFQTFQRYRKYTNLLSHRTIAAVFGWSGHVSVQFEGEAELLCEELLADSCAYYLRKVPSAKRFMDMEGACLFRIHPLWARYTDISKEPSEVFEINLGG